MSKNVLIVHYNPRDLEQRSAWAEEMGLTATVAHNCDEALNAIACTEFLLALIDPLLPGMSGFSLAEKIASSAPRTIVLLASALYKRMQFVAHPGAANIRMVHLDKPLDETSFKTLMAREHVTDPDDEQKTGHPEEPKSEDPPVFNVKKMLELDPELDKLIN